MFKLSLDFISTLKQLITKDTLQPAQEFDDPCLCASCSGCDGGCYGGCQHTCIQYGSGDR